jgi:mannose-6-phosphate isomerase
VNITGNEKLYPLKFHPIYMERVWGGTMMSECLGRELPPADAPIGESWELVDRDDVKSVVSNGELTGVTLQELVQKFGSSLIGRSGQGDKRFPLMVKLIDAGERLSLQVHPDEKACSEIGGGAEPKTEMWYVIANRQGAEIFAGLSRDASRVQLMEMLDSPNVAELMQTYKSQEGDAYFITSGTLHAIGAGNLILEIQQNSDTTYRVNDWGRLGTDGKPRTLHKEEGMKSINLMNRMSPRVPRAVGKYSFNRKVDIVKMCPHFKVSDLRLCDVWRDDTAMESFHLVSAVKNRIEVGRDELKTIVVPGETVLVPACFGHYTITPLDEGDATVIKTTL